MILTRSCRDDVGGHATRWSSPLLNTDDKQKQHQSEARLGPPKYEKYCISCIPVTIHLFVFHHNIYTVKQNRKSLFANQIPYSSVTTSGFCIKHCLKLLLGKKQILSITIHCNNIQHHALSLPVL